MVYGAATRRPWDRRGPVRFLFALPFADALGLGPQVLGLLARPRERDGQMLASALFVAGAVAFPPLQGFLGLATPGPFGLALCGLATLASLALSRGLAG